MKKTPPVEAPDGAVLRPINPPDGWQLNSSFGYMGVDNTSAGRLVRLADVLRWVEASTSLDRDSALQSLCDAMPLDVMAWLYKVQQGKRAEPVAPDALFGYPTAEAIAIASQKARQDAQQGRWENEQRTWDGFRSGLAVRYGKITNTTKPQEATEPGRAALLKLLRASWPYIRRKRAATVDVLDEPRSMLNALAIPFSQAHAHWSWGSVAEVVPLHAVPKVDAEPTTWAGLVAFRRKKPSTTWTVTQKNALSAEFAIRNKVPGATGVATSMAGELSISVSRFNGLKRTKHDGGKRQKAA